MFVCLFGQRKSVSHSCVFLLVIALIAFRSFFRKPEVDLVQMETEPAAEPAAAAAAEAPKKKKGKKSKAGRFCLSCFA